MKNSIKTIFLLGGSAFLSLSSLSAVTTDVVGYTSTTLPAGAGSIYAPSFVHPNSAVGVLEGVSAGVTSTFTVSGLEAGAFDEGTSFPLYYVEILNDTNGADGVDTEGLVIDVVSNTASTVVVGVDASVLGVQGDEQYCIRKHLTLGDITEGATGFNAFDAVTIYNGTSVGSIDGYLSDGSNGWTDFSLNPASDAPIYPGTGVVFNTAGAVTLLVNGTVKETPTQVSVYGNQINIVSAMKPLSNVDMEADGAIFDTLGAFDAVTLYAKGALTPSVALLHDGAGNLVNFDLSDGSLVIDGTSDAVVMSTASDSVYKATGTVITD